MKHLLKADDIDNDFLNKLFVYGGDYHRRHDINKPLTGKVLATLFFEPSTRTKLSFHAAMYKLGGSVIDLPENSSQKKGESDADTVKTISQYADILVIRHPERDRVAELAQYSDVPVINAGDGGNEHPTQALIDLYTISQYKSNFGDLRICNKPCTIMFTGDVYVHKAVTYSRTVNSLVKLLRKYSYNFIFASSVNWALKNEGTQDDIYITDWQIKDYIEIADVLYMTRHQKERNPILCPISNFVLTEELANKMKADAIIMHPLPRNKELPPEIDKNHRAKYFNQVKNGLWVRMALLKLMTK